MRLGLWSTSYQSSKAIMHERGDTWGKNSKYERPESFNVFIDLHNLVRNQSIRLLFHDRSKKDQSKTMLSPRGQKRLVEYFIISTDLNNRTSSNSTTATSRVCLAAVYSHQKPWGPQCSSPRVG